MRYQNPRFGERDSRDQNVVWPDALTGGFKMYASTAGDLGNARVSGRISKQSRSGSGVRDCARVCAAMRAEHHFRDGDNRESDILLGIGCERGDGAGALRPRNPLSPYRYRADTGSQTRSRLKRKLWRLAKSSSTRPITSVSRSAGQPFLTASATTDSGTRALVLRRLLSTSLSS
jgi:hypothetical protein